MNLVATKSGAAFKRGQSNTSYETPVEFVQAVEQTFGVRFEFDLAGTEANKKAPIVFTEEMDSLKRDWPIGGNPCFLNPPYDNIKPWAKKCSESRSLIFFLVPAAVGSNWYRDYCYGWSWTCFVNGRVSFDGKNPYPKDLILCIFGLPRKRNLFNVFDWRNRTLI